MSCDIERCMSDIDCTKCGNVILSYEKHIVTRGFGRWDYCLGCYDIKSTDYNPTPTTDFIPSMMKVSDCKYEPNWVLA